VSDPNSRPHFSVILVGVSHQTASIELREQLALEVPAITSALGRLKTDLLPECVILSTCNRLEVYALAQDQVQGWAAVELFFAERGGQALDEHLYRLSGTETIEHLLRVACGLESMILGESQILGQVGDALKEAQAAGAAGATLSHLFAHALHAGKRARTETAISHHPTSISHAAARAIQGERGHLADLNIVIIGAGEMAELAARAIQMRGAQHITVINRTYERAAELAKEIGGQAVRWEQLSDVLAKADVILSATGAPYPILSLPAVEALLPERTDRPLLVIDIAVPRDVDPAIGKLPDIRCFNIDDLQATLDGHQAQRQAAVPQVEAIIEEEQLAFLEWLHSREVVPVISELYHHALAVVEACAQ
jgi:glutamyl-tRNA reductase